ncbi:RsmB/NOP family class I SAM-dependent RNA methyltransferase [Altererythrobacter confluentis]|uniref:RsmB/NOP family class I SAM-dependent RNA methyltransferase n=1 Tax=Allopontixanthobacter confluentis TaxID=1849021 RepID=A0A6L7GF80_9SPHN|nr:RsmB/NOP family class I SAM-dependent RNA methyltransferase [Allopontixanthobacter confluentis]MXP14300.1 RsmB/NOP family class I SAM-dependent RNA methyltransferase [Allopontixanthobacter confluentis]
MIPGARVQAAIELLDSIITAACNNGAPADRLIAEYFRTRRYAGSKDRRAVRELVYAAIRACGPVPADGRAAMLRLAQNDPEILGLFDGVGHGPATVTPEDQPAEGGIAPQWLMDRLQQSDISGDEAEALLGRAPLDLRVNTLKADRSSLELPEPGEALAAAQALRFEAGTQVEQWDAFKSGMVEVQDHGSQWACAAMAAQPGETIIDLCAGAGGKTLALAAMMENRGVLIASDTDRGRLSRLPARAERAGAGMIETVLLNPGRELEMLADWRGTADGVLVDAPCSGTGTWRRNPEARWRLDERQLERFAETQSRLLDLAAMLVKPGGRITYITCSLLDMEGRDRIDDFLDRHPGWASTADTLPVGRQRGGGHRLTPFHDGTDGFFIASLGSAC